jgi:DNA polymerase III subunit beta
MKIVVGKEELVDAVSWVAKSLSSRPIQSALLGILIEAEEEITLTASDLETTATAKPKGEILHKGKVLVSGRLLVEIVKTLPNSQITLTQDGSKVLVTAGSAKFALPTQPVHEFPPLPKLPSHSGSLKVSDFVNAVNQVGVAAGRDDSLPTLTGVNLSIEKDTVTLAATDRYRLAVKNISWSPEGIDSDGITLLRARTLTEIARSLSGVKEITIGISPTTSSEKLVGFEVDGKTLVSRVLDGAFPPYAHLLPKERKSTALINRAEFLDSVKRVSIVADKTVPLRLSFAADAVNLEAGGGDEAQASESLQIKFDGEPIQIAFNPAFLIDGLSAIESENVFLSFTESNKPAVLSETNGDKPTENYNYLLMPMKYSS